MRVLILSDANSPHTIKWIKALIREDFQIGLWSLGRPKSGIYDNLNIIVQHAGISQDRKSFWKKLKYLSALKSLNRFINEFKPDVLHAHYASSYGLLGKLVGFHPYIISVWGSDVYDFPEKNALFEKIIKKNLNSADVILSTSDVMKRVTQKFTDKDISVIPFGIDLDFFDGKQKKINSAFTIGTVKTLEDKYGIDYLIKAFHIFYKKYRDNADIRLLIVGGGSKEKALKQLCDDLDIAHVTTFTGNVDYSEVPYYHAQLDIAVFLSTLDSESFGVSVIEASASFKPVVVSDVGGLPEVTENNHTGVIVPSKNTEAAAAAIERLFLDETLRYNMGVSGRKRVERLYDLKENARTMAGVYKAHSKTK